MPGALECTDCRQSGVIARTHGGSLARTISGLRGAALGRTGDAVHVQRFAYSRGRSSGVCTLALCRSPSPLSVTCPCPGHARLRATYPGRSCTRAYWSCRLYPFVIPKVQYRGSRPCRAMCPRCLRTRAGARTGVAGPVASSSLDSGTRAPAGAAARPSSRLAASPSAPSAVTPSVRSDPSAPAAACCAASPVASAMCAPVSSDRAVPAPPPPSPSSSSSSSPPGQFPYALRSG